MAARLSQRLGWLGAAEVERIVALHAAAGLPVRGAPLGAARYLELMGHDKKVMAGRLRLVLLQGIGAAVTWPVSETDRIADVIDACCDG
jgi:3-dehydroquinate synthase